MRKIVAVIVAAGLSSRMESNLNKPFIEIANESIIRRTLLQFIKTEKVSSIIVMVHANEIDLMKSHLKDFIEKQNCDISIFEGGATRQESVYKGLIEANQKAENPSETICLVHDAARCLIRPEEIISCAEQINESISQGLEIGFGVGVPVTDTIHFIDEDACVKHTPDRASLIAIQTPQGAKLSTLLRAHEYAQVQSFSATDDISVLQYAKIPVKICPGDQSNIKITHQIDITIAEKLLDNLNIYNK